MRMRAGDENTRLAKPRACGPSRYARVQLDTVTAWLRPELLTCPSRPSGRRSRRRSGCREWAFYLQDVLRWKPHTLPREERIVAMAGELRSRPARCNGVLKDADLLPDVKLLDGRGCPAGSAGIRVRAPRATGPTG